MAAWRLGTPCADIVTVGITETIALPWFLPSFLQKMHEEHPCLLGIALGSRETVVSKTESLPHGASALVGGQ